MSRLQWFQMVELSCKRSRLKISFDERFLFSDAHVAFELPLILRSVEVPERFFHEAIRAHRPLFEATDAHWTSGTTGAGVRASQRPTIHSGIGLESDAVHANDEIRKCSHEPLRGRRDF